MDYNQQPHGQYPPPLAPPPQQQQPVLPPWYRTAQPGPQSNGPPAWGGASSNGSSSASSNTAYSNPAWRTQSPSPYQRPNTPGRGGGSSWGAPPQSSGFNSSYGPGYGSGGARGGFGGGQGRGYGRGGGRGRGSTSPQRAPSPPVWLKEDCWLVPKPGSVEAAAHAAAVARHRQLQRQQQQSVAVSAGEVAAEAAEVAAVAASASASAPASDTDVIDLTGDDSSAPAAVQQLSGLQLLLQQHRQQQQQPPPLQQQQQPQAARVPNSVVYIMRGLPGSGKSTRAAEIAAAASAAVAASASSSSSSVSSSSAEPVAIHSTDSYFVDPVSGVYDFNPELLPVNHQKNFEAFCASLAAGVDTIIVDNTNIQPWQYEKYVQQAWSDGYRVREEVVGEFTPAAVQLYAQRNVHGVPLDKLHIMLEQWQRQ